LTTTIKRKLLSGVGLRGIDPQQRGEEDPSPGVEKKKARFQPAIGKQKRERVRPGETERAEGQTGEVEFTGWVNPHELEKKVTQEERG